MDIYGIRSGIACSLVDDEPALIGMLNIINDLQPSPPSLFLSIKVDVSRRGGLSLMNIFIRPIGRVFLVDIFSLQSKGFTIATEDGTTLKSVLQSTKSSKVFFDVRKDAEILAALYGISMGGVEEVQLMDLVACGGDGGQLRKLMLCVEQTLRLPGSEEKAIVARADKSARFFTHTGSGNPPAIKTRPLDPALEEHCVDELRCLSLLRDKYWSQLSPGEKAKVKLMSQKRALQSVQAQEYNRLGRSRTISPFLSPFDPPSASSSSSTLNSKFEMSGDEKNM